MKPNYIFWSLYLVWFAFYLAKQFNLKLAYEVAKGKRKFSYLKIKVSIWPDTGQYEFRKPETFKEPYRTHLKNHTVEILQLVEILEESDEIVFCAGADSIGNWDFSFRDKSRLPFSSVHIDKSLIMEITPVKFSWKRFCLEYHTSND